VVKWDDVQTKIVTWGIIAILAGIGAGYVKLLQIEHNQEKIELRLKAAEENTEMVKEALLDYWEHLR
jgi:hypothetical protein